MSNGAAFNGGRAQPPGTDEHMELQNMESPQRTLPVEEDIMQLARLGEISAIQKLFDSGKYDATCSDEQGITPLHWAAINNHYALCHFLIQCGANVNAKGGDAVATPVLWAAKRCHYYVVNLLLQHGADPLLTDDQGFNLLHSATLDGNVFQLVLLLHQDIPVDIPDAQGHTSLMWAAYKGFPACVDLFLRWGSNVYAKDDMGFTALHWALVKGSQGCITKLVEYGSDRFAENNEGKTPAVTARDMNSLRQWKKALSDCGYHPDGRPIYKPFASYVKDYPKFISRFFFVWPFLIILCCAYILSHMVIYAAVPTALIVAWGMQWAAQQTFRWSPPEMKHIHKTPFLAGIFAGSLFWVGVRWLTTIMPWTYTSNPFYNLLFVVVYGLCAYFYFAAMLRDPGYIKPPVSRSEAKATIDELLELRQFDETHFCVKCMIRRPLRSKHCNRCKHCVAKEDHHCPWVDNCIAVNNHRHFVLYVIFLELGVITFIWLVLAYLQQIPVAQDMQCVFLEDEYCEILNKDPFTIVLAGWSAVQLVWVTMLLFVQLLQISRATTTYENMKGHLHHRGVGDVMTSFVTTGSTSLEGGQVTGNGGGPDAVPQSGHPVKESVWKQWKRLLGVDTFVATALHGSNAAQVQARQRGNPFTRGLLTNCKDFWCDPAPLFKENTDKGVALLDGHRVDYTKMYEPPPRLILRRASGAQAAYAAVDTDDSV